MQKLIIIDKDISYIHTIFTNISKTINNIKLYNFYLNDNVEIKMLLWYNNYIKDVNTSNINIFVLL